MSSSKKKKKKPKYSRSAGRYLLEEDLRTGKIPLDKEDMSWQDALMQRPEFIDFDGPRLFPSRLKAARSRASTNKNVSAQESASLARDRLIFPKKATNHRGEPQWEGSDAQKSLRQDVAEKKHLSTKPHNLQQSRPEYQLFPLSIFRNHIYQEDRYQKWIAHRKAAQKEKFNLPNSP